MKLLNIERKKKTDRGIVICRMVQGEDTGEVIPFSKKKKIKLKE